MKELQQLVVAIDFSRPCINALQEAARMAQWSGAKLVMVHVVDEAALDAMRSQIDVEKVDVLGRAASRLKEFVESHGCWQIDYSLEIRVGHPFEELVSFCESCQADLLVMGAQGNSGKGWRTGVLASNCVRRAPVDVLLVRGFQDRPFKQLLVCVDFSETAKRAIERGLAIARQDRAAVEFLFVFQPINEMTGDLAAFVQIMPPVNNVDYRQTAEKDLEIFMKPFLVGNEDVDTRITVLESSRVADAIIGRANDSGVDLVLLGTRGRTGLKRLLMMGTTAERIVSDAPCSVLTLKPTAEG
ncbi:MAG: universal stress protein [Verrucomicrobiales bacterium]|nr:universal stress protein [Verrucomicrobiales bacterium]